MNTKTQKTLSALDIALAATAPTLGKQEGEFTVAEYAARAGRSIPASTQHLNRMVAQGQLTMRHGISADTRRTTNYYGPPKQ